MTLALRDMLILDKTIQSVPLKKEGGDVGTSNQLIINPVSLKCFCLHLPIVWQKLRVVLFYRENMTLGC